MHLIVSLFILLLTSCASKKVEEKNVSWQESSRRLALAYAKDIGPFFPEEFSRKGFESFNGKTISYTRDYDQKLYALLYKWNRKLDNNLKSETNLELKKDIEILYKYSVRQLERIEAEKEMGVVPFLPVSQFIYLGLVSTGRTQDNLNTVMARFRSYVRGRNEKLPLIDGYLSYVSNRLQILKDKHKKGIWPSRYEVNLYLKESDEYLAEIEKTLKAWPNDEWKRDFVAFKNQEQEYREFLRKKILPYTQKRPHVSQGYYDFLLSQNEVVATSSELMDMGLHDYRKTLKSYKRLSAKISNKLKLLSRRPVDVLAFLKNQKIENSDYVLMSFQKRAKYFLDLIIQHKLFTIKSPPVIDMRLNDPVSESWIRSPQYFPFTNSLVIPRVSEVFPEEVDSVVAHKVIPGHAFRNQKVVPVDFTLIRKGFFNLGLLAEGWGYFAEGIIYPYVSDETKFLILHKRLLLQARMFLDPELNLGRIGQKRALEVLVTDLGLSKEEAISEINNMINISPARAPMTYYGYKSLRQTRRFVKDRVDSVFDEKCFNDAFLELGLIPVDMIKKHLMKNLNCVD